MRQVDLAPGKLRPVVLLAELPGRYDDWLVAMASSQLGQAVEGFDEVLTPEDEDFAMSGLKVASVVRLGRLAVVADEFLLGAIGELGVSRVQRMRERLAQWISGKAL